MKSYDVKKDMVRIRDFFDFSQTEFANELLTSRATIARYERGNTNYDNVLLESIYDYAYSHKMHLNKAKESFYQDDKKDNQILLFHGTGMDISVDIDINHSYAHNDFGNGFYLGTSLDQSATHAAGKPNSSVYVFYFENADKLDCLEFEVSRKWMLAVLFYRGAFDNFKITKEIKEIIYEVNKADYIIAPIADNQMYQIFNKFIHNEITDVACYHALCASNLGKQYIFKTDKALKSLKLIDRFYMCKKEKDYYSDLKKAEYDVGISKASIALKEYRREGKYFDEIFKRL